MQLQNTPTLGKDTQFTAWNQSSGTELHDEALTNVSQLVLAENGGLTELLTLAIVVHQLRPRGVLQGHARQPAPRSWSTTRLSRG